MNRMYWITGILGLLLIIAPFVLVFNRNPAALWIGVVLGAALVVVSGVKGLIHDATPWEYWAAGILGILAAASPFALGFSELRRALYTSTTLGVVVLLAAAYQIFKVQSQVK